MGANYPSGRSSLWYSVYVPDDIDNRLPGGGSENPLWREEGEIPIGDDRVAEYFVSQNGIYFFNVRGAYEGNTIGNFLRAAREISKKDKEEIAFSFSGQRITIDSSNPESIKYKVPEGQDWLKELVEEELFPPEQEEIKGFLKHWFLEHQEPVQEALVKLQEADSRVGFDNPAEYEDNVAGVLQVAWDIRAFVDEFERENEDIMTAEEIRGLASDLYNDAAEKGAYFRDPDEALKFTLEFLYRLGKGPAKSI